MLRYYNSCVKSQMKQAAAAAAIAGTTTAEKLITANASMAAAVTTHKEDKDQQKFEHSVRSTCAPHNPPAPQYQAVNCNVYDRAASLINETKSAGSACGWEEELEAVVQGFAGRWEEAQGQGMIGRERRREADIYARDQYGPLQKRRVYEDVHNLPISQYLRLNCCTQERLPTIMT